MKTKPSLYQRGFTSDFYNYFKTNPEDVEHFAHCLGFNVPKLVEEITGIKLESPPFDILTINLDFKYPEINYSEVDGINLYN